MLLQDVELADRFAAHIDELLVLARCNDQHLLLHQLINEDGSDFFKTSVRNIELQGVWIAEVEVREQVQVELSHS